jgi:geranyl-CoA carboxylase beta subunit
MDPAMTGLSPRERMGLLLDGGRPFLPLCGLMAGIGFVAGVRCMVWASEAGTMQPIHFGKVLRLQEIALASRLPFVQLAEEGGLDLALISAAGLPVITVRHGAAPAACVPGVSGIVIMIGPAEAARPSCDLVAADDRHALGIARELVARTGRQGAVRQLEAGSGAAMPAGLREVMAHLVDDAALLEFQALQAAATVCAQARLGGHEIGLIADKGAVDAAGAGKALRFMQWMGQLGHPIVHLQDDAGEEGSGQQITIRTGRRGFAPRFRFSWRGAPTAQADAVIEPGDTRPVLAFCLDTLAEAAARG